MRSTQKGDCIARFGAFEADLQNLELRNRGLRVKLQVQPFRILALLLQRSGEIVPREDLRTAIWNDGTFIEFDHGINTAMQKVRRALNDSPANPRFVETLPRRGYRFLAPVEFVYRESRPTHTHSSNAGSSTLASIATFVARGLESIMRHRG